MSTTASPASAAHTAPAAPALTAATADACLARIAGARVAVLGDLCLDAYWWLDEGRAERSLETSLPVTHVGRQRYGLGAAGNVAANLAALGAARVELLGLVGEDCFGDLLLGEAKRAGIDCAGVVRSATWQTMVYAKPIASAGERPRIDFGAGNRLSAEQVAALAAALDQAAARCGAVVINQQVGAVLADPALVAAVGAVIARHPATRFIVDARHGADRYPGAALKLNAREAARLLGRPEPTGAVAEDEARALALALQRAAGRPVFLTRGERGLLVVDGGNVAVVPGIVAGGRIDPVGAGDAVTAALAAGLAVGLDPLPAAQLANLAAAVTIRKLDTTGCATPAELRALAAAADHLHEPELAEDPRAARFLPNSEIEVVRTPPAGAIAHAIFDHDGTISTLRQGWEAVMQPMMVRAILGPHHGDAPAATLREVEAEVHALIDRTTGIQTLAQMHELAAVVRARGFVPADEVLDAHGYKRIYNDALLARIRGRLDKLAAGELEPADFQIKGALALLHALHARGVRLYLASGTDQDDVRAEAAALGYAGLFAGGIHGAVGSLAVEAKRDVMDRILATNGIAGGALLVVGDGPVEIREGRRRGALCLGVASDEPRRYGLDPAKRARLIRAGADLVVGDFTQLDRLLPALGFSALAAKA